MRLPPVSSRQNKNIFGIIALILLLIVTACGGGGEVAVEETAVSPTEPSPPAEASTEVVPTDEPEPTPIPTPTAEERLDLAISLMDEGAYTEAAAELEAANEQTPNNIDILANLGGAYIEMDRLQEAEAVLSQAYEIDDTASLTLLNLCTVRSLSGQAEVIDLCQAALAANPDNANAHNGLGIAYFNTEQLDLAAEQFMTAIALAPDEPDPQNNLGLVYANQGQADLAIEQYQKAIAADPTYTIAYGNLGLLYQNLEEYELAVESYTTALELNPEDAEYYRGRALAYVNLGDLPLAIEDYETSLEYDPTNMRAINNLAYANAEIGELEKAVEYWQLGIDIDPTRVEYLIDMGLTQTELGDLEGAIVSFNTYLEAAPEAENRAAVEEEIARLTALLDGESTIPNLEAVDFTDPAAVLEAVFVAAQTESYDALPWLCDPLFYNDGDTTLICQMNAEHDNVAEFVSFFANGRISGEVTIDGEFAEIPFVFGPENDREEVMRLILRNDKWYLYEF